MEQGILSAEQGFRISDFGGALRGTRKRSFPDLERTDEVLRRIDLNPQEHCRLLAAGA